MNKDASTNTVDTSTRSLLPDAQLEPRRRFHCLRAYLYEFPGNLQVAREDLRLARWSAAPLWPFVWRATMDDAVEHAGEQAFELGRESERYHAERTRQAPAVGAVHRTWREAMGLTLAEVAERAGVEADYLERIESGEEVGSEEFLLRLARIQGTWTAERQA